jgi:hypothetical protein
MRTYKGREFARFARKSKIPDIDLCRAVDEILRGSIDADLGGGVFKQRVRRKGRGKSGSFRTIILLRIHEIAIFVFGFSKSERANITSEELLAYRKIAKGLMLSREAQASAVAEGKLIEVRCEEN